MGVPRMVLSTTSTDTLCQSDRKVSPERSVSLSQPTHPLWPAHVPHGDLARGFLRKPHRHEVMPVSPWYRGLSENGFHGNIHSCQDTHAEHVQSCQDTHAEKYKVFCQGTEQNRGRRKLSSCSPTVPSSHSTDVHLVLPCPRISCLPCIDGRTSKVKQNDRNKTRKREKQEGKHGQ